MTLPPYPLCWPDGMARTPPEKRAASQFKTTLAGAVKNGLPGPRDLDVAIDAIFAALEPGSTDPRDGGKGAIA